MDPNDLTPSELFVGEKTLIYLHSNEFSVFNSFWYGHLIFEIIYKILVNVTVYLGSPWKVAKSAPIMTALVNL